MNHDWHVLFTMYCRRICDDAVTCYTPEEFDAAWTLLTDEEKPIKIARYLRKLELTYLAKTAWDSEPPPPKPPKPVAEPVVKRKTAT